MCHLEKRAELMGTSRSGWRGGEADADEVRVGCGGCRLSVAAHEEETNRSWEFWKLQTRLV